MSNPFEEVTTLRCSVKKFTVSLLKIKQHNITALFSLSPPPLKLDGLPTQHQKSVFTIKFK
jgi:hypothetical protein